MNPLDKFDDVEIMRKFWFRRADIISTVDDVEDELQHVNRPGSVPPTPSLQVCLALRLFACGSFQDVCGELLNVSQPTASRTMTVENACAQGNLPDIQT